MTRSGLEVRLLQGGRPPKVWHDLLRSAAEVSYFHEEAWNAAVATHLPGVEGAWLLAMDGDRPVAGWPFTVRRRGPFRALESHHGGTPAGPLLAAELAPDLRSSALEALCTAIAGLGRRGTGLGAALFLEAARDVELAPALAARGFQRTSVPVAVMPLAGGLEHVEMNVLKMNRRNERNRAIKAGVEAEIRTDDRDLEAFHAIYRKACEGWGIASTPLELCRDLLRDSAGKAFLVSVRRGDDFLGGHLCLQDRDRVTAWLGASLPRQKGLFPATVIVWTELEEACRRGAAYLDLGSHGGQGGVANFKKLLGAETEVRARWDLRPPAVRLLRWLRHRSCG